MDASRRGFLRGAMRRVPLRPPWAVAEPAFTAACTRCGDCVRACPPQVLAAGDGGYPTIRFEERGCTLCGDCVAACKPLALRRVPAAEPWSLRPVIGARCLATQRVECRICGEACEAQAIRFRPRLGGISEPELQRERCTGCGSCVAPCPVRAIVMQRGATAG